MKGISKSSGPAVVAAVVATAGAAVAITILFVRKNAKRPGAVVARCDRAIGELERQMTLAPSAM